MEKLVGFISKQMNSIRKIIVIGEQYKLRVVSEESRQSISLNS